MRLWWIVSLVLGCSAGAWSATDDGAGAPSATGLVIKQNFAKDDARWFEGVPPAISEIVQTGKVKRYTDAMLQDGVHFRTGTTFTLAATVRGANFQSGGLLGVHGAGSHCLFTGRWQGDQGGAYPMLALTEGGQMTWTKDAMVDLVMHPNFFTRQLWAWGDGTGVLELAEGFRSDVSKSGTVAEGMGTIRLAGLTLITHHSQSLPFNTRPDGRGGVYHNGHVVFEGDTASTWSVRSNAHRYGAQVDFAVDGSLDCQSHFTHNGQLMYCLAVGNGGPFVSSGAFRTTRPNVTITKTGAGMLSLEGQQAYQENSRLLVKEGLLRLHTDPASSSRVPGKGYGDHLHLHIHKGAKLVIAANVVHLAALTVDAGARVWQLPGCTLHVAGERQVHEEAEWVDTFPK